MYPTLELYLACCERFWNAEVHRLMAGWQAAWLHHVRALQFTQASCCTAYFVASSTASRHGPSFHPRRTRHHWYFDLRFRVATYYKQAVSIDAVHVLQNVLQWRRKLYVMDVMIAMMYIFLNIYLQVIGWSSPPEPPSSIAAIWVNFAMPTSIFCMSRIKISEVIQRCLNIVQGYACDKFILRHDYRRIPIYRPIYAFCWYKCSPNALTL